MSDAGTTLLTGATGNTGSGVAGSLLESGHAVRALVRDPDKASALQEAGAELVVGDLDDPATLLQPTFFMQNVMMTAPTVKEQGTIYWDWGVGRAGMVDVRDVVDSAVGALTTNAGAVAGRTFVLTGPRTIGFAEVADILSRVVGREIAYAPVLHEAAGEALLGMGLPEWIVEGYAELSEGFANGFADMTTGNVEKLAGHPPRLRAVRQRLQADLGVTVRRAVGRRERRHEELERAVNPRTARLNHMRNVHTTPIRRAR